ncbi:MAG: class I SAM-dependent methyltransferase [Chloroflexi bacterium]|nr:class I SAM-dependent methyltransferase [Chloroflexota bacterium]
MFVSIRKPRDHELFEGFLARNLPAMATTFDEGLGIASERYFLNRLVERILPDRIETVLEAPVDGLMGVPGMNSVVFARRPARVWVGSPSRPLLDNARPFWEQLGLGDRVEFVEAADQFPFADRTFDLAWNYCTFERFRDAGSLLDEMIRVSRRYVFVVTQNYFNYGTPIHKLYHWRNRQEWDHGYDDWTRLGRLEDLFRSRRLHVVARGCVDVPPWLDTFDMHIRGKIKGLMRQENADRWHWSALQDGDDQRLAHNPIIRWLDRFQSLLFFPLNYLFAHHFYLLGRRPDAD